MKENDWNEGLTRLRDSLENPFGAYDNRYLRVQRLGPGYVVGCKNERSLLAALCISLIWFFMREKHLSVSESPRQQQGRQKNMAVAWGTVFTGAPPNYNPKP